MKSSLAEDCVAWETELQSFGLSSYDINRSLTQLLSAALRMQIVWFMKCRSRLTCRISAILMPQVFPEEVNLSFADVLCDLTKTKTVTTPL